MLSAFALLTALAAFAQAADAPVEQITLQQAVERALRRSPSVAIALQETRRAEALVRQVRAGALPTLTANGVYTRLDGERRSGGVLIAGESQLGANLVLAVPLVNAQRWVQWEHAGDNVKIAQLSASDLRRQIAVAVARAYLAVLTQRRVLDVNERARVTARAHLEFASTRLKGGVGNKLDEVRAGQELAAVVSQLEAARATLARAQESLGVAVASEEPLDAATDPELPDVGPLAAALDAAENARADIRGLKERKAASDRVVRDSWADYLPFLTGVVQPFVQTPATSTVPNTGWQAQLLLSLPLYDGGLRYGLQDERRALAAEANEHLVGAIRQARADVRGAFTALLRADDALKAARDGAQLAGEALALATLAYKAGAVTNLEVIDAERRARDAETTVALAEDTSRQARLDLLSASGRFP